MAQGVPEEAILVEGASFNTEQNLDNARALMDERGWNCLLYTSRCV